MSVGGKFAATRGKFPGGPVGEIADLAAFACKMWRKQALTRRPGVSDPGYKTPPP